MFLLVEIINLKLLRSFMYIKPLHIGLLIWVKYFVVK